MFIPLKSDSMLPLGLSMLWESVEPEAALEERFGFNSFGAAPIGSRRYSSRLGGG